MDDGENLVTTTPPAAGPKGEGVLAEFSALREEIIHRQAQQSSLFLFQLTSSGAIFAFVLSNQGKEPLLLVVPVVSYLLASRYAMHHLANENLGRYIRDILAPSVSGALGWEGWIRSQPSAIRQRFFVHPIRVAFPGTGTLALVWLAGLAANGSFRRDYSWPALALLAVLWLAGLAATVEAFRMSSRPSEKWRVHASPPSTP